MLARGRSPAPVHSQVALWDPYTTGNCSRLGFAADAAINNTDLSGVGNVIRKIQGQASDAMQGKSV